MNPAYGGSGGWGRPGKAKMQNNRLQKKAYLPSMLNHLPWG